MNVFAVDAGKIWSSLSEDCFQGGLVVCTRCIWKLREQCHSKTEMQYMQYSAFGKDLSLAFLFLPTSVNSVTQQNRRWSTLLVQSSLGYKLFVSISSRWLTCWLRLTDWVLLPLPPRALVKDDSLSAHNYTNPRNLQHQCKFWWDAISGASSSAMLYVHIVLGLCACEGM